MPRAFILVSVEGGTEDEVLQHVKTMEFVEEVYVSYGVYDLILKVKADTMSDLKDDVTKKIRQIKQVRSSLTLIMTDE